VFDDLEFWRSLMNAKVWRNYTFLMDIVASIRMDLIIMRTNSIDHK
jgi:hypothetical protein